MLVPLAVASKLAKLLRFISLAGTIRSLPSWVLSKPYTLVHGHVLACTLSRMRGIWRGGCYDGKA